MDAAKVELMRALGRLLQGLSVLVWAVPATIFLYIETARATWFDFLEDSAFLPAMLGSAAIVYALRQFHDFQKQERIWQSALHRAEFFAIINTGLSPFLFWWRRFPAIVFYSACVGFLALSALIFLMQLNYVARRLCAMLPDEALRSEIKTFASLNVALLFLLFVSMAVYLGLAQAHHVPPFLAGVASGANPRALWCVLFFGLMPLALTVAILWRIKEVIFRSIIEAAP